MAHKILKKSIVLIVVAQLISLQAFSQSAFSAQNKSDDIYMSRISEYFFSNTNNEILHPVRLLGGVNKPGLYHLPVGTNLTTLLAISGGTANNADVEEISIRLPSGQSQKKNLKNIFSAQDDYKLSGGEVVFVPQDEGFFTPATAQNITVIATVLSLLLSAIIVNEATD